MRQKKDGVDVGRHENDEFQALVEANKLEIKEGRMMKKGGLMQLWVIFVIGLVAGACITGIVMMVVALWPVLWRF